MTVSIKKQPDPMQLDAVDQAAALAVAQLEKAREIAVKEKVSSEVVLASLVTAIASNYACIMNLGIVAAQAISNQRR